MEGLGVQLRVPIEAMEQVCSIKALLQGRPTGVEVGMNHHEKICSSWWCGNLEALYPLIFSIPQLYCTAQLGLANGECQWMGS